MDSVVHCSRRLLILDGVVILMAKSINYQLMARGEHFPIELPLTTRRRKRRIAAIDPSRQPLYLCSALLRKWRGHLDGNKAPSCPGGEGAARFRVSGRGSCQFSNCYCIFKLKMATMEAEDGTRTVGCFSPSVWPFDPLKLQNQHQLRTPFSSLEISTS